MGIYYYSGEGGREILVCVYCEMRDDEALQCGMCDIWLARR